MEYARELFAQEAVVRVVMSMVLGLGLCCGDAVAAPEHSMVSSQTNKSERIGQCFDRTVKSFDRGSNETSADTTAFTLNDGRFLVDTFSDPGLKDTRVGDKVRLCVAAFPKHCPRGDTRGFEYRGLNQRTGARWKVSDDIHLCGGA